MASAQLTGAPQRADRAVPALSPAAKTAVAHLDAQAAEYTRRGLEAAIDGRGTDAFRLREQAYWASKDAADLRAGRPMLYGFVVADGLVLHIDERTDADLTAIATAVGVLDEPATVAACRSDYAQAQTARGGN